MNLTPRRSDRNGLSVFDTAERAMMESSKQKAQEIAVDRLRELEVHTGDGGHFLLRPADPEVLTAWIASRGDEQPHPLSDELAAAILRTIRGKAPTR